MNNCYINYSLLIELIYSTPYKLTSLSILNCEISLNYTLGLVKVFYKHVILWRGLEYRVSFDGDLLLVTYPPSYNLHSYILTNLEPTNSSKAKLLLLCERDGARCRVVSCLARTNVLVYDVMEIKIYLKEGKSLNQIKGNLNYLF